MVSIKKIFLIIIIFLAFLGAAAAGSYFYVFARIKEPFDKFGIYKNFTISQGESLDDISAGLARDGFIREPFYFKIYVWQKGIAKSIKAGDYNLSSEMNISKIAEIIAAGRVVDRETKVLITEGLTIKEIEKTLEEKKMLKEGDLVSATEEAYIKKYYSSFDFFGGKPDNKNLEGYLFPDTYKFYNDTAPEDIVRKMLENFGLKFSQEMRDEASRQGKSIYEILTLASIVQEEANGAEDMKIVAGVFKNRLEIGKPLEADSTINFITGKKMRQAFYSDLEVDSPYNTYKYAGLPPGPIDNPGLDAIKAVLWPRKTDYLYFLHTPEGVTIFSKTYQEHLQNQAKYL